MTKINFYDSILKVSRVFVTTGFLNEIMGTG